MEASLWRLPIDRCKGDADIPGKEKLGQLFVQQSPVQRDPQPLETAKPQHSSILVRPGFYLNEDHCNCASFEHAFVGRYLRGPF